MKTLKSVGYWAFVVLLMALFAVPFFVMFVAPYFGIVWQFFPD